MKYSGIIFDLDGTLADSIEDLTDAMNYGLAQLGLPAQPAEVYRKMVGDGVKKFVERALGPEHVSRADQLLEAMTGYYLEHCLEKTLPYSGMKQTVETLSAMGIRLAVLTNKNHAPSVKVVEHLFGSGTFNPIIGMSPGRERKPDPASAFEILNAWSLPADRVLFVGDSDIDIHTAKAAGMEVAGAAWGYRTADLLKQSGADTVIDHPKQILDLLNGLK